MLRHLRRIPVVILLPSVAAAHALLQCIVGDIPAVLESRLCPVGGAQLRALRAVS